MNSKLIKKILILAIVQSTFSNIAYSTDIFSRLASNEVINLNSNIADRYALPKSKVNVDLCQREALRLHPGVIEKLQLLHRHGDFLIRIEIHASNGFEWFMLCNLTTGKAIDTF